MSIYKKITDYSTEVSDWQVFNTKRRNKKIVLYEDLPNISIIDYQQQEIAPQEILGDSIIQTEDQMMATEAQMWADFWSLAGAWADRDDIDDDWLDNLRNSWDDSFRAIYGTEE